MSDLRTVRAAWSHAWSGALKLGLVTWRIRSFSPLVSVNLFAYAGVMYATAVVEGRVVRFKLSPALARAHRQNRGKTMTEGEAVVFVEAKQRARALRRARPYLASRP